MSEALSLVWRYGLGGSVRMGRRAEPNSGRPWGRAAGGEQCHQRGPRREDAIAGDRAQVFEHPDSRSEALACPLPQGFDQVAGPVQGEGEQVQRDQHAGQGLLAVAEVVFEVVAPMLEDIEGFVLDFPAGAPAGGQFGDRVPVHGQIGDEGVAVGDGAVGAGDLDLEPVHAQGVVAVADGQAGHEAVAVDAPLPAPAHDRSVRFQGDAVEILVQGFVAVRLAGEDEAPADRPNGFADRLAGIQIVAQVDRAQCAIPGTEAP